MTNLFFTINFKTFRIFTPKILIKELIKIIKIHLKDMLNQNKIQFKTKLIRFKKNRIRNNIFSVINSSVKKA